MYITYRIISPIAKININKIRYSNKLHQKLLLKFAFRGWCIREEKSVSDFNPEKINIHNNHIHSSLSLPSIVFVSVWMIIVRYSFSVAHTHTRAQMSGTMTLIIPVCCAMPYLRLPRILNYSSCLEYITHRWNW